MESIIDIIKARYVLDSTSPSGLRNRYSYNLRKQCKAGMVSGRKVSDGSYLVTIQGINYTTKDIIKLIQDSC